MYNSIYNDRRGAQAPPPWICLQLQLLHLKIAHHGLAPQSYNHHPPTTRYVVMNTTKPEKLLLMVQKSHSQPPGMYETL